MQEPNKQTKLQMVPPTETAAKTDNKQAEKSTPTQTSAQTLVARKQN
jgi:hypothetical protein